MAFGLPRRHEEAPPLYPVPDMEEEQDDVPDVTREVAVPAESSPAVPLTGEVVRWQQEPPKARPIFAAWIINPNDRKNARRWLVLYAGHTSAFHAVRVPVYFGRAAMYAPRGAGRAVVSWHRWVFDSEGAPLRRYAVEHGKTAEYMALSRQRNQRVKTRLWVTGGSVVTTGFLVGGLTIEYTTVIPWALAVAAVLLLGWNGRRVDRPFIDSAILTAPGARKLTPDMVIRACIAAKLCKEDEPITFVAPGVARDGEGFLAVFDLPFGQKAATAIKRRDDLAAGLDVDEVRVFVDRVRGDTGSARRVSLWVADRDPYAQLPPITPLAGMESVNFWKGVPFGLDARRRPITLSLVWSSLLVGAIPRMGKTFAARIPPAGASLDPHVRLIIADGKGGRDWKVFTQVAHWYGSGIRLAVVEALVNVLRECVADMNRRYEVMADLPDDVCPESKITPALASDKRRNMPLTLIALDEVQRYLEHPVHGEVIGDLLTDLVKVGPAAGYMLVLATQKPDSKTIPPKLRDNTGTRFALKVMNWQSSEAILGAGTYGDGLDASKLLRKHKGVGLLLGADDGELAEEGGQVVRTHLMDNPTLSSIVERGRQVRINAGTLTGVAAGMEVIAERATAHLLEDTLAVFEGGEARLWSETACSRLAAVNPDAYSGWEPTTLAKALKGFGVETRQIEMPDPDDVDGARKNRKGITRQAVLDALADR